MNIERLQKLKDAILAEPHHYEQNMWISEFERMPDRYFGFDTMLASRLLAEAEFQKGRKQGTSGICGTACCMAGMAVVLSNLAGAKQFLAWSGGVGSAVGQPLDLWMEAREWLDLTDNQARVLFTEASTWPPQFSSQYVSANTLKERAQVGAAMIDWLIENADIVDECCFGYQNYPESAIPQAAIPVWVSGDDEEDLPF